jgi:hypothetical protein
MLQALQIEGEQPREDDVLLDLGGDLVVRPAVGVPDGAVQSRAGVLEPRRALVAVVRQRPCSQLRSELAIGPAPRFVAWPILSGSVGAYTASAILRGPDRTLRFLSSTRKARNPMISPRLHTLLTRRAALTGVSAGSFAIAASHLAAAATRPQHRMRPSTCGTHAAPCSWRGSSRTGHRL